MLGHRRRILRLILLCLAVSICLQSGAQTKTAGGVVTDAQTGEVLEFIAVYFKNTTDGCVTNHKGEFYIRNTKGADTVVVDAIGYSKLYYKLKSDSEDKLSFAVVPEAISLQEVYVRPRREKYRNAGNPAVDLVRNVIENSDRHKVESKDHYSCDIYEKLTLSLDDFHSKILEKEKYKFLYKYIDTSDVTGKPSLTISVRENIGKVYYRKHPKTKKTLRLAQRIEGVDEELDNNGALTASLEQLLTGVNVFDNEVSFLGNRFVSPLSKPLSLAYYKYYIMDTVHVKGSSCVDLAFVPRNPESYGFTGRLYVTADSTYSVKKVQLNFPAKSNVNWVSKLEIEQEFEQTEEGLWVLSKEDSYVTFSVSEKWQSVSAHHSSSFRNYDCNDESAVRDDIYNADEPIIKSKELKIARDDSYWQNNRHAELETAERQIAEIKKDLDEKTHISTWARLGEAFVSEWVPVRYPKESSCFNFGPVLSFVGYNYIEKFRVKIGGMTTANISDRWFTNGYLAYGTGDKKLKGQIELIHSFNPKNYHSQESLRNNLSVSYSYDIFSPEAIGVQHDLSTSLKANSVKAYQYIRTAQIKYDRQWTNGLTTQFTIRNVMLTPATTADPSTLSYVIRNQDGQEISVPNIKTTEFGVFLRWAPGERQTNALSKRRNIDKDTPVLTLQHRIGVPEFLGGEYYYNRTDFSFTDRIRLSAAGFLDMKLLACKVWNEVPWPLLCHPAVNSSFSYRSESFNTMDPLEFITDQYLQWNLTWHLKGLVFNRLPLVKRLNLREIVLFNGLWGNLSDKNNPLRNHNLFVLPHDSSPIGKAPFMEVGAGIENIFRCYRIVYFHRINYGHNDNETMGFWSGFRLGVYIDF